MWGWGFGGQVWLAVNGLLLDADCRRLYAWTDAARANAGRLAKHLNELVVDQLPLLAPLRRWVQVGLRPIHWFFSPG